MGRRGRKDVGGSLLLASVAVILTIAMVLFPEDTFSAALKGLRVWWEIVFPALLPFFVFSEILMGLGVVNAMGVLLEPLMRPLFNVPGVGSFVMAMGLASGYPLGAILTAKLRRQNACTQVEAERLISFANTADPLFMFGAVAVGMFGDATLGTIMALAHYLASLGVGVCMRFYRRHAPRTKDSHHRGNIIVNSLVELHRARKRDGRPLGQLMGDAIRNSVQSLLTIGGFIIIFSVLIRLATIVGAVDFLGRIIAFVLAPLGVAAALAPAAVAGIFEITIGTQMCSTALAPLQQRVAMAGAVIAWSGLSVHGQVASIINDTDIRLTPYLFARLLHAVLAFVATILLWNVFAAFNINLAVPAFLTTIPSPSPYFFWHRLYFTGIRAAAFLGIAVVFSALVIGLTRIKISVWRVKA
ncbi:MAG: sporulation integral membrane protein YlbJ [Thermaerobacter sp.]|nr:sporulation integral membrane protein YlbJ [Thermaerobacter sp.]